MRYWVCCIFILFSLASCHSYKEVSVSGIESFSIKKLDKKEMTAEIGVKVKNPNDFGFTVYSGKADIYLAKMKLGNARLEKKVRIPAQSSGTYFLLLRVSFDKINLQDIINNFSFNNLAKMKIDGHIKAGKFIFRKKIKTEYEGNLLNGFQFDAK